MRAYRMARALRRTLLIGAVLGLTMGLAFALWLRRNPSACPYGLRFSVDLPHPVITRSRLHEILAPEPGERILEVGPGTGYYSLGVAERLAPYGTLDVLDVQQGMLEVTASRARERGLTNVVPTRGDATALPYPDRSFDAVYLALVLGEVSDQDGALREFYRVLKPGGRLVVGEVLTDLHMVPFETLRERTGRAGLRFERRLGGSLGFFARFGGRPEDHGRTRIE